MNPLAPGAAYTPGVVGSSNEYVIHDDPLAHLPPQVLQLLNEKNIALRLWPPARVDVRMRVRWLRRLTTGSPRHTAPAALVLACPTNNNTFQCSLLPAF